MLRNGDLAGIASSFIYLKSMITRYLMKLWSQSFFTTSMKFFPLETDSAIKMSTTKCLQFISRTGNVRLFK